jgi:hypothetical protein
VPPAATIRLHDAPVASSSSSAQPVQLMLDSVPLSSYGVYFSQSEPGQSQMATGKNMYVWENSGAVFAAEADGTKMDSPTTLIAGSVDQFVAGSWLNNGNVALIYTEDDSGTENIWTIVFNSKTSVLFKQELGPGTGTDVHIVPYTDGGFAVSWESGSQIDGVGYDAKAYGGNGWIGPLTTLTGDLIGLDSAHLLVAAIAGNSSDDQLYEVYREADVVTPLIDLSPTTLSETVGSSGLTAFTFTLTRSDNTTGTSTVNWMVQGDGAQPASAQDFENDAYPTGTVNFAAGQTQATVTVEVNDASDVQNGDTFTFTLTKATGADLGAAVADATILTSSGSSGSATEAESSPSPSPAASSTSDLVQPDAAPSHAHSPADIMMLADWLFH